MPNDAERWTLTFVPHGDGPPVDVRVARLLKLALRAHHLRCVSVSSTSAGATVPGQHPPTHERIPNESTNSIVNRDVDTSPPAPDAASALDGQSAVRDAAIGPAPAQGRALRSAGSF